MVIGIDLGNVEEKIMKIVIDLRLKLDIIINFLFIMSKQFISADRFMKECFLLANKVYLSGYKPDIVLGIWRGGSIPAIVVHEFLRFRRIDVQSAVITIKSYVDIGKQSDKIELDISKKVMSDLRESNNILIVDDILDSGRTMKVLLEKLKRSNIRGKIKVSSVYYKPKTCSIFPDYYLNETDQWVVFPHELEGLLPQEIKDKKMMIV